MSKMGEYIREKMEIEMVDSVDELEDVKNGMGGSSGGNDSNGSYGCIDTDSDSQKMLQEGDPSLWITLEDHGDLVEIREGSFSMILTSKQVEHLHFMLEVLLREKGND